MDPVLTAFAQLGTLRLDAQRALISLFGRREQHVLTEATRTLSLQDDANHDSRDELWIGSCTMSYDRSLCKSVMGPTPNAPTTTNRVFVVPDLTQDDDFKAHPDVTSFPNIRFLASSPIVSPKGIVIGAYTILDDKPHEPLDTASYKFLTDISATVMDYLEKSRSKGQHLRSERMIVGLGSFLEGKGSLRSSWVLDTDDCRTSNVEKHAEGQVNQEQQAKQVSNDVAQAMVRSRTTSHLPFHPYNLHIPRNQAGQVNKELDQSIPVQNTSKRDAKAQHKHREASRAAMDIGNDQLKQRSPKDDYTAKVNETFSRAANLIRESIEVESVVFFNANFSSQEGFVNSAKSDPETSSFESCSSGDDCKSRSSLSDRETFGPELAENCGKATLNPCQILGFSTSNTSSINDQLVDDKKIALSESFLGALLHRYPRGKIFNFGEDGTISSGDTSDGIFKRFFRRTGGKKYKKTRTSLVRQDAQALLQLAPESRSIVFTPLWDSHKGRWYSGAITWTAASHRIFTSNDELAFLLTFGNSVMAEVHRLGAHFADRAKSDLLSGLSHELRSPLHGIFGTAELLNDTTMDALQRGFIHTISSCAFTLLGSINQLLEYASINDVLPSSGVKTPGSSIHGMPNGQKVVAPRRYSHSSKSDVHSYVELDTAVEEAVEAVFAGYSFFKSSNTPLRSTPGYSTFNVKNSGSHNGVTVVLDIDHAASWKFSTRPGAWHVILTNVFGNALKFTSNGYIHISMRAIPVRFGKRGEVISSKVTMTIKDTGSGIHSEYLENGIFAAFSQEDSMTSGNGLGLNITRRLLLSLGGDIEVHSKKNVGTEVVTTVILNHAPEPDACENTDAKPLVVRTKELSYGKTIGILGLGTSELDTALYNSLQKLCRDWFSMDVCLFGPSQTQPAPCDFYISPHEYFDLGNQENKAIVPDSSGRFASPVIIICSSPLTAHSMFVRARKREDADVLEFISQPCGPRKLAKALEACIERQQQRIHSLTCNEDIPDSKTDSIINQSNGNGQPTTTVMEYSTIRNMVSGRTQESLEPSQGAITKSSAVLGEVATLSQDTPENMAIDTESAVPTTILLVDDNDINLKILIAFMKKLKCEYVIAQNGEEALDVFKASFAIIAMIFMGRYCHHPLLYVLII